MIIKTSSLSLPALLTAPSRGPEEDKSICISARLNDLLSINLHTRDNSFVFKMALHCANTDRASEKWRILMMLTLKLKLKLLKFLNKLK